MSRLARLAFVVCTLLATPALGQAPAAPAASSPEPRVPQPDPQPLLVKLPADHTNVILVGDLLPRLTAMFEDARVRRLLAEGPVADLITRWNRAAPDPDAIVAALRQNEHLFPLEAAIALPDDSIAQTVGLFRGFLLGVLAAGVDQVEMDNPAEVRERLQHDLLALLEGTQTPRLSVMVKLRREHEAILLMNYALVPAMAMSGQGLPVEMDGEGLKASLRVGDHMDTATIRLYLDVLGITSEDPADDELAAQLATTLTELNTQITFTRRGTELVLTLGPLAGEGEPALSPEDLGPLFGQRTDHLVFTRFSVSQTRQSLQEIQDLWNVWKETPLGGWVAQHDTEEVLSDLSILLRQLAAYGDTWGWSLATTQDGPRAIVLTHGAAAARSVADLPLRRALPPGAEAFVIDGTQSLGHWLSNYLFDAEDRASRRSLQAELRGEGDEAQAIDSALEAYYRHFATLRKLIHHRAIETFAPGAAIIFSPGEGMQRLAVQVRHAQTPYVFHLEDVPAPAFALLGRVSEGQSGLDFARDLGAALVTGTVQSLRGDEGAPPPEVLTGVTEADLGLGVPTLVFESQWFAQALRDHGNEVSWDAQGDIRPHVAELGDMVLFSTSPSLSRQIVDAWQANGAGPDFPLAEAGQLVAYGRTPGSSMADVCDQLAQWPTAMSLAVHGETVRFGDIESWQEIRLLLEATGATLRLVEALEWRSVDAGGDRRTTIEARLVEP